MTRDGAPLALEDLVAFLRQKGIAAQKLPERLEMAKELPYTPTGKLKKFVLREQIAGIIRDEDGRTGGAGRGQDLGDAAPQAATTRRMEPK